MSECKATQARPRVHYLRLRELKPCCCTQQPRIDASQSNASYKPTVNYKQHMFFWFLSKCKNVLLLEFPLGEWG
eukprot:247079-Amphidinium_carterae.1